MRLWFDDIRRPPDASWLWARTLEQAQAILSTVLLEEASLDHDLGLHDVDPDEYLAMTDDAAHALFLSMTGQGPNGQTLAAWMVENDHVPPFVTLHSFNPAGASRMLDILAPAGHVVHIKPFEGSR